MLRSLCLIVIVLLSFIQHSAFAQEQSVSASAVVLVNKPKQPANQIHRYSNLYFKFDLSKLTFPLSKAKLTLPIKSGSKGNLYLKASADWTSKKLSWAKRPALSGPVLAKVNVTTKQIVVSKDLIKIFKSPKIYTLAIYGNRGTKVYFKNKAFTPKLSLIQSAGTPTPVATATPSATAIPIPTVTGVSITRGPYLQRGNANSMIIRWRTNVAGSSSVYYGPSSSTLSQVSSLTAATTEHRIEVTGLSANSTYYYKVGANEGTYQNTDENQFFVTSPEPGSHKDTRVWVVGDSGTANASARAVRDAYLNFAGSRHTDFWLMLGDNAYFTGTDAEFQNAVFDMYPSILKNSVVWPAVGNHDASDAASVSHATPYFDQFSLPRNAEAGGIPSGTESYYSFDYGDIHFISLNSTGTAHRSSSGPMKTWLISDLAAAANRKWIIAFWHHPPYSKGSHNSDTEIELKQMRENFLPILEDGGVDLVLSGHSHTYERSYLVDGYYGLTTDFNDSFKKSNSGSLYTKKYFTPHAGTIYMVAGSSGQTGAASLNHPVMYNSQSTLGSVVLDFTTDNLNVQFLTSTGAIADAFSIRKSQ